MIDSAQPFEPVEDWHRQIEQLIAGENSGWNAVASSADAKVWYNGERQCFLKLFFEAKWSKRLRARLLPDYARHRRFVSATQKMVQREFVVPEVLAAGDWRDSGYVVTRAFDGLGLGTFFAQYLTDSRNDLRLRCWKRKVAGELGRLLAHLHGQGVVHGDLRPNNILLSCTSAEPRFCFIDNERNRYYRGQAPLAHVIRNLSQLNMIWPEDVSSTDRLRVLKAYLNRREVSLDEKTFIRRITAISNRRLQGRPRGGYRQAAADSIFVPNFDAILG